MATHGRSTGVSRWTKRVEMGWPNRDISGEGISAHPPPHTHTHISVCMYLFPPSLINKLHNAKEEGKSPCPCDYKTLHICIH